MRLEIRRNAASRFEHYCNAWRYVFHLHLHVSALSDGSMFMHFIGNHGKFYRIEMSTDLVHWTPLGTSAADADDNVEFTDPKASGQPLRFYRAVEQETDQEPARLPVGCPSLRD